MKKFVTAALFALIILGLAVEARPAEIYVADVSPAVIYPNIRFIGDMPQISGLDDERFQEEINNSIRDIYERFELLAVEHNAFQVGFSFEHVPDGSNHFIKIFADITAASESRQVQTVGFDAAGGTFLTIEDFLGPNAVALTEDYIAAYMRRNPGLFNSVFGGLSDSPSFFTREGRVVFLFGQSEIAPARLGVTRVEIDTLMVRNVSFTSDEYITVTDFMVKMIPLREAAEGLGYSLEWSTEDSAVIVTKESFETRLEIGRNSYALPGRPDSIELESAPLLRDGVTYVPISFFDAVLGARHSTDGHRTVTISIYTN
ncbi:MAG: copper amine oxidase N-terminal domain-containing protein [Defluviitaleaceae bacterium]|nr:copper amine oxidase N-terminal domain-containing protein [Defluviitaleaceae bacterium]